MLLRKIKQGHWEKHSEAVWNIHHLVQKKKTKLRKIGDCFHSACCLKSLQNQSQLPVFAPLFLAQVFSSSVGTDSF